jgi:hypothetical protein
MRAHERDRPSIGIDDEVGLVGRTPLQVDVPDPPHIPLLATLADVASAIVARQDLPPNRCRDGYDDARQQGKTRLK